jgi:hypothetical protein
VSDKDAPDRVSELERQREWAENRLAGATKGHTRVRQLRGSNAHERGWKLKEQMDAATLRIQRIDEVNPVRRLESETSFTSPGFQIR